MKKETFIYPSFKARMKNEYRIILAAFLFIVIADFIGQIEVPVGPGKLILFPIFYALILGIISGPEILKFFKTKEVKAASGLVIVAIYLALVTNMFGPDSPETRGSLSIYVVGGMVGTIYFGFLATMTAAIGFFHPYALGMASGVGAGILMASSVASLTAVYPDMAAQISALASTSETISGLTGIYVAIFVGIPLTKKLYEVLEPRFAKLRHEPSEVLTRRQNEEKGKVEEA